MGLDAGELGTYLDSLRSDLRSVESMISGTNNTELAKRLYISQVFVFMETAAHILKSAVLTEHEKADYDETRLGFDEWMTAYGESYRISDEGLPQYEDSRYRTVPHVLFCLRILAKFNGVPFDPRQAPNWDSVGTTRKVRDRLTHPKRKADLLVTDKELADARRAFSWFESCVQHGFGGKT